MAKRQNTGCPIQPSGAEGFSYIRSELRRLIVLFLTFLTASVCFAGDYTLISSVVDNGGGIINSTDYQIVGSVTADPASPAMIASADYAISNGFIGQISNSAPVPVPDLVSLDATGAATVDVLLNDTDPENDTLTVTGVTGAVGGTASVSGGRFVNYTANAGFTGTGSVTYTVRDAEGNLASSTVTFQDTSAPVVSSRPAEVREATGPSGAAVTFGASTVADNVGATSISYAPDSGSVFPLGDTVVTVTARDAAGNTGTGIFTVTVRDTTAPVITSAPTQRAVATSGLGGQGFVPDLTSVVVASDAVGVSSVTQTPAAGTSRPAGTYPVTVTVADAAGNRVETVVSVVMNDPVVITAQPQGVTVNPGQPVSLSVSADGTGPFTYQWRRGGTDLAGANGPVYSVAAAAEGDEGVYSVVVGNAAGSATSAVAAVVVNDPVVFTVQPQNATVNPGTAVVLVVTVTGTGPLSYQWRKNGNPVAEAQSATLTLANAQEAAEGTYDVVVTNPVGSATSAAAQVQINDGITIQTQPSSRVLRPGEPLVLNVVAAGTGPLEYQWRRGSEAVPGATGAEYRIESSSESDSGLYDVVVRNVVGEVTSQGATVTVSAGGALTFSAGSVQRLKPASELLVPIGVRREGVATGSATVRLGVRGGSLAQDRFALQDAVLTWAGGETGEKTGSVVIKPGVEISADGETIELGLDDPAGAALGERRTMVVMIRPLKAGTVMFTATSVERVKPVSGDLAFEVAVARSPGATGAVSVDVVVAGGTAAAADYTIAKPVRLSWEDGDVSDKTFPVVYRGSVPVAGRTIVLKLLNATGGALIGGVDTQTLAIRSATVPGTIGFAETATLAAAPDDGERIVPVVVRRTLGANGTVSAQVTVAGGNASGTDDYALPDVRTLTWADGDLAEKVFNVRLRSTAQIASAGETIVLKLQGQTGGALLGVSTTTITVLSSSAVPVVSIATPKANATVTGDGAVVRGAASDANGVARVEVALNGAEPVEATLLPAANGTRVEWMIALVPEQGANTVRVTAVDTLGNRSVEAVRAFKFNYEREEWAGVYDGLLSPETSLTDLAADYPDVPQHTSAFAETRGWGVLSVSVTPTGAFSGRLLTGGVATAFKGVLRKDGTALFSNNLASLEIAKGRGTARKVLGQLALRANASGQYPVLAGELTGTGGVVYGRFTAAKAIYSAAKVLPAGMQRIPVDVVNPALENGRYTALFEPRVDEGTETNGGLVSSAYPQVSGYAVMTAAADGTVKLVGRLADGTAVSIANRLSPERTAPVFASLYGDRGWIAGTLRFDGTQTDSDAAADQVSWYRPAGLAAPFASGWPDGITVDLVASKYVAPAKPSKTVPVPPNPYSVFGSALPVNAVLGDATPDFIGMQVRLTAGGLAGLTGNLASLNAVNGVTLLGALPEGTAATGLKLAYLTKDGSFIGQFTHPVSLRTVVFGGVTFQKQPRAAGFFPGVPTGPAVEARPGAVNIVLP